MKLSIVILCWNDFKVISDCLRSICSGTHATEYEIIISDNGSSDGSQEFIRRNYPSAVIVENGKNLGFAAGNNAGIQASRGEYVLILNPDTIVHEGALGKLVDFADRHQEAGGFGCRVLSADGSYQISARPFPTLWRLWLTALHLWSLGRLSPVFTSDVYPQWTGDTERPVDWQSGCCVMFRSSLLKQLGGFDEQFFYYFEETDLCRRVWNAGYPIIFTPEVTITHLGSQSVKRAPLRFELERFRNRYRYFYKYFGRRGARRCRRAVLVELGYQQLRSSMKYLLRRTPELKEGLEIRRLSILWNKGLDPVRFVEHGEEPEIGSTASERSP